MSDEVHSSHLKCLDEYLDSQNSSVNLGIIHQMISENIEIITKKNTLHKYIKL